MARRPRDSRIESPDARTRLKAAGTPYWKLISPGLALEGVPLKFIADALGHCDTRMAEKHYAHLQRDGAVAEAIRDNLPSCGKAPQKVESL